MPDRAVRDVQALSVPSCTDTTLLNIFLSRFEFPALACGDNLGVFTALAAGATLPTEVADRIGATRHGVAALLALLAHFGVISRVPGGFELTELGRTYLLPESPFYWGPMLRMAWDSQCGALRDTLRDGQPRGYAERDLWSGNELAPRLAAQFTKAMDAHALAPATVLAATLDLREAGTLLDVGGGSGAFARAFTAANPGLAVALLDLPAVCAVARTLLDGAPHAERISVIAGDMFTDDWPDERDVVLFANVFHDWPPAGCRVLVAKAHAALRPGGRVFVHEILADQPAHERTAAAYSLAMMATTGGKQYADTEIIDMLSAAGFVSCVATHSFGAYWVVAGRKEGEA